MNISTTLTIPSVLLLSNVFLSLALHVCFSVVKTNMSNFAHTVSSREHTVNMFDVNESELLLGAQNISYLNSFTLS